MKSYSPDRPLMCKDRLCAFPKADVTFQKVFSGSLTAALSVVFPLDVVRVKVGRHVAEPTQVYIRVSVMSSLQYDKLCTTTYQRYRASFSKLRQTINRGDWI